MPRKKKKATATVKKSVAKKSTAKKKITKKPVAKKTVPKAPVVKKTESKKTTPKKKKTRKKKRKPHPLEGLVNFEHAGLKSGDEVVYKRLGDGATSIGIIQYFEKTIGAPSVTVIDLLLGTFHTSLIEYIDRDPTRKLVRSLWAKAEAKGPGRRRKQV